MFFMGLTDGFPSSSTPLPAAVMSPSRSVVWLSAISNNSEVSRLGTTEQTHICCLVSNLNGRHFFRESSGTSLLQHRKTYQNVDSAFFQMRERLEGKSKGRPFLSYPGTYMEMESIGRVSLPRILTCVGASQIITRVQLFDDVLVDLVPLTLCVTPRKT